MTSVSCLCQLCRVLPLVCAVFVLCCFGFRNAMNETATAMNETERKVDLVVVFIILMVFVGWFRMVFGIFNLENPETS
jgi:hypothetical protein